MARDQGGQVMSRLRKSGGYRDLRTFRSATLIYDATYWFYEKYLNPRSRTIDQMVQAARSGRQNIAALEKQFIKEGGYSKQLAAKRLKHRSDRSDQTDGSSFPPCPQCGKPMVLRTAKTGQNAGKQFLGCSGYPDCKGAKNL